MNNAEKRVKFFQLIAQLILDCKNSGIELMPTCYHRTIDEQIRLFKQGKSKTLKSKHLNWLAMDFVLIKNGEPVWSRTQEYEKAGEIWESLGGTWGGRWDKLNDIYHFELKDE